MSLAFLKSRKRGEIIPKFIQKNRLFYFNWLKVGILALICNPNCSLNSFISKCDEVEGSFSFICPNPVKMLIGRESWFSLIFRELHNRLSIKFDEFTNKSKTWLSFACSNVSSNSKKIDLISFFLDFNQSFLMQIIRCQDANPRSIWEISVPYLSTFDGLNSQIAWVESEAYFCDSCFGQNFSHNNCIHKSRLDRRVTIDQSYISIWIWFGESNESSQFPFMSF